MSQLIEHERITAFIDGELNLADQLEMERRYESDLKLRQQVDDARALRSSIRDASYHTAPEALRERLAALMPPAQAQARAKPPARKSARPTRGLSEALADWFNWRPLIASAGVAAAAVLLVNTSSTRFAVDQRLEDEVVASHVRSTLGQHLVDVSSSDHHQVKPYLSNKLGFSPPVAELPIQGSEFLGGRVDYLDGRTVAALVYKQGPHVVNSFIWPTKSADAKPTFSQEKGFRTAHWIDGGMAHWVISDVNAEEFQNVVQAVRKIDEQH